MKFSEEKIKEIKQEELKVCEAFVNGIFEISKKYELDLVEELQKLSLIVTGTIMANTIEEDKDAE